MKRLGRNTDRYLGETIDIAETLSRILDSAPRHGWTVDLLDVASGPDIPVLHRKPHRPSPRVYLSTGIHGDEPAGPKSVQLLVEEDRLPRDLEIWLFPCLNPTGFPLNTRAAAGGIDLNRDYRDPRSPEIRAHAAWLHQSHRFDLALCLHEDWEASGFYVYELNPDDRPSLATAMIDAVSPICPVDLSPMIDGREARNGVIHPIIDPNLRPEWPEALFLLQHKTRQSYTLETPSDFELAVRTAALAGATRDALARFRETFKAPRETDPA